MYCLSVHDNMYYNSSIRTHHRPLRTGKGGCVTLQHSHVHIILAYSSTTQCDVDPVCISQSHFYLPQPKLTIIIHRANFYLPQPTTFWGVTLAHLLLTEGGVACCDSHALDVGEWVEHAVVWVDGG